MNHLLRYFIIFTISDSYLTQTSAFTSFFLQCFISGIVLLVLSVTGLSSIVMKLIPRSVKLATIVGMGLQIALVGMTSVKLVVPNEQTIVGLGDIHSSDILLSILGLVLIGSLLFHQVRGGILIGILAMTLIDWAMKGHVPAQVVQLPDLNIDVTNFISFSDFDPARCMTGILAFLFIGVIDVSGVIFGMASLADLTEPDGHTIPGSTPTFVAVALSSLVSAMTGGTPVIVYVESAAGIKEGGRTGLTAVIISFYFIMSLFFAPVLSEIPLIATSPVAILVGAMMMSQSVEIDWNNMSEAIPAFLTLVTMPFTFSITNGIVLGLITAFMFYITTGQAFVDVKVLLYGPSAADQDQDSDLTAHSTKKMQVRSSSEDSEQRRLELAPGSALKQSPNSAFVSSSGPRYAAVAQDGATSTTDMPIRQSNTGRSSFSGHHQHNASSVESHSFIDEQTFVRHPSLILRKKDAEAVRDARGFSVGKEELEESVGTSSGVVRRGSYQSHV